MSASAERMHGGQAPTAGAHTRDAQHQRALSGCSVHAFDSVLSAGTATEPPHMHGMRSDFDTFTPSNSLQTPGRASSVIAWLRGWWTQRVMHEYHAPEVPASDDIATHMKTRYDMHTPMHLVLWHMLRDCRKLLGDAFSIRQVRSRVGMHEQHALYRTHACSSSDADADARMAQFTSRTHHTSNNESAASQSETSCMHGQSFAHTAEQRAIRIAVVLAFFNQISASSSIINYAPVVLKLMGVESWQHSMELAAVVSCYKTVGIILGAIWSLVREHMHAFMSPDPVSKLSMPCEA